MIFALFLTAQLISLATNMVVSTFLRNWLAEDAKSYNKSVIDSLEATMNSMLTEISRLVQVTTIAADSVDQLHDYDSFTPEDYIQVQKVAQDLSFIMGAKQSISSWFYYYPEKNLVISNGSIYQAETYFSKYSFYDSLNPQRLEELIEIPSHLLLGLDIQNRWSLAGKSVSQEVVPFVTSYRNLIRQKALMIVNIQASYLYNQTLHYRTSGPDGPSDRRQRRPPHRLMGPSAGSGCHRFLSPAGGIRRVPPDGTALRRLPCGFPFLRLHLPQLEHLCGLQQKLLLPEIQSSLLVADHL